jgi:hypothetical protein
MKIREVLGLALRALEASSPHTDAWNRWKDAGWLQLRRDAIGATAHHLERLTSQTVGICIATAENAASQADTPGATAPCTDAELLVWLLENPRVELSALATSSSNREDEPFSVVEITEATDGGALSRIELLATGSTRRGALCAAVNRQKAIAASQTVARDGGKA